MSFVADPMDSVQSFKVRVAAEMDVMSYDLQLLSGVTLLKADASLVESGIQDGSSIDAVVVKQQVVMTLAMWNRVKLWLVSTGECILTLCSDDYVGSATLSRDGTLALTTSKCFAKIWEVKTGNCLRTLSHNFRIDSAVFSPGSTMILTAPFDEGCVTCWHVKTNEMRTLAGRGHAASFSSDEKWVLTCYDDTRIWDVESGECLRVIARASREAVFSPDKTLVLISEEGHFMTPQTQASLFRVDDGTCLAEYHNHGPCYTSAVFSPDGASVLMAAGHSVKLWNIEAHECRLTLHHDHEIYSALVLSDGSSLLIGSADGSAKIWDADARDYIQTFRHEAAVVSVSYAPQ